MSACLPKRGELSEPFAITFTSSFGIDNIELARISSEVFQILGQINKRLGGFEFLGLETDLPARLRYQTSNLHAIDGTTGTRNIAIWRAGKVILATRASGELNGQSFTLELSSIYCSVRSRKQSKNSSGGEEAHGML